MNQGEDPKLLIKGNNLRRGFKSFAERTSADLRKKLGLKSHEHLCAFELAKHLQVNLFLINHYSLTADEMGALENGGFSAVILKNHLDEQIIIHNEKHSPARQQSNVMHELAHVICKHSLDQIETENNLPFLRCYNKVHEDEASWLGACLQLPRTALAWALYQRMSNDAICSHFKVSSSMLKYRMNITGIAKQFSKK